MDAPVILAWAAGALAALALGLVLRRRGGAVLVCGLACCVGLALGARVVDINQAIRAESLPGWAVPLAILLIVGGGVCGAFAYQELLGGNEAVGGGQVSTRGTDKRRKPHREV